MTLAITSLTTFNNTTSFTATYVSGDLYIMCIQSTPGAAGPNSGPFSVWGHSVASGFNGQHVQIIAGIATSSGSGATGLSAASYGTVEHVTGQASTFAAAIPTAQVVASSSTQTSPYTVSLPNNIGTGSIMFALFGANATTVTAGTNFTNLTAGTGGVGGGDIASNGGFSGKTATATSSGTSLVTLALEITPYVPPVGGLFLQKLTQRDA